MSADTGTSSAATIRAITAAARLAPRPAPSGTPRDQATPALVVAIATAEATSHAFGSSSGSPGLCRFAKAFACCACFIVMTATLASCTPSSWPDPDSSRRSAAGLEPDDQLVVEFGELDDHARELAGDQVAVGRRARVRVIGGLIGEVLDEQQVVRLRRIPVHPERQGAVFGPGPFPREVLHDRVDLVLRSVLELDGKHLH